MTRPALLIADDQRDIREALRLLLKAEGIGCVAVDGPAAAIEAARRQRFDAALIDLNYTRDTTSGAEGLDLLRELKKLDAELPVVVMTAWGTIDVAVEAMRLGAGDFVEKPWDNQRLTSIVRNQLALGAARRNERRLAAENELLRADGEDEFIATSAPMRALLATLQRVAPSDANVLILGENGTGKGVLARLLHERSRRAAQPFVKVNMGGIPESVFEAEMFGHVRGAFTDAKSDRIGRFELADGGSLFLDEIANIPVAQQAKLLRVLEDGELERVGSSRTLKVDVRVISATNADLPAAVADGAFRKDLLFRLNTVELHLPALRERGEDIGPLVQHFDEIFAARDGVAPRRWTEPVLARLRQHAWPGNVRELRALAQRLALLGSGEVTLAEVEPALTGPGARLPPGTGESGHPLNLDLPLREARDSFERAYLLRQLHNAGGSVGRLAQITGMERTHLYRKLRDLGIDKDGGE